MLYKCCKCECVQTSISMRDTTELLDGQYVEQIEPYLKCVKCGASSSPFVKAKSEGIPRGSTIDTHPVAIRTKTERYVIALAGTHEIENEDIHSSIVLMEKGQFLSKQEATKLYTICMLERAWLTLK